MQFGLSEEQTLLLDNVNRFLDDNSPLDRVRAYADGCLLYTSPSPRDPH